LTGCSKVEGRKDWPILELSKFLRIAWILVQTCRGDISRLMDRRSRRLWIQSFAESPIFPYSTSLKPSVFQDGWLMLPQNLVKYRGLFVGRRLTVALDDLLKKGLGVPADAVL